LFLYSTQFAKPSKKKSLRYGSPLLPSMHWGRSDYRNSDQSIFSYKILLGGRRFKTARPVSFSRCAVPLWNVFKKLADTAARSNCDRRSDIRGPRNSLITRSGRPHCKTIAASIKALRNPPHWQRAMAPEANLTLYMFDGRLCEYTSRFGRVRLSISERTSADSSQPPYLIENTHRSQTLSVPVE
jgi:hypothetical protein